MMAGKLLPLLCKDNDISLEGWYEMKTIQMGKFRRKQMNSSSQLYSWFDLAASSEAASIDMMHISWRNDNANL